VLYQISPTGQISGGGVLPLVGIPSTLTFDGNSFTVDNAQNIPISAVASQQFNTTLSGQACTIKLFFKDLDIPAAQEIVTDDPVFEHLQVGFVNLYVNDALIIGGVRAMDRNLIVRNRYLGFVGDIAFVDTQGTSDPVIDGLGSRFLLFYWAQLP
jgi:hypothetical protein